ncbi:hypothetical protein [Spiroplasma tabanidicola]|uniref:Transmembrane protein n=1 Tax=Spiroplasma tabanidicola TaxID=324079 RepID=A0A6I6C6U0_9MOLU|nr:hypothetical protein [Spiroplasma tabanidicola]QGS51910.1 hypothetical protein STABA_v1c05470 [Spiroplasma tabanidicola]
MKNNINPKSYTLTKYLLTISMLSFYLLCFLMVVVSIKTKQANLGEWWTNNYLKVGFILQVMGMLFGIIYFLIRYRLHKRSEYKYNKKESYFVITYLCSFILLIVFCFLLLLVMKYAIVSYFVLTFIFIIFVFILGITISVLETISRLKEQALVNKVWFENNKGKKTQHEIKEEKKAQELLEKNDNPFMEEKND